VSYAKRYLTQRTVALGLTSIPFLAATAIFLFAPAASASIIYTYTYTGNDFQYLNGTAPLLYTTSDFVTVTFTLSAPLGDNLSGGVAEPSNVTPLTWSFSDGVQTDTSADPNAGICTGPIQDCTYFDLTTNGSGTIVDWFVDDQFSVEGENQIQTLSGFPSGYNGDVGSRNLPSPAGSGDEFYNPGVWSVSESSSPSSVPEGPSFAFLLLGLASIGGLARFDARRRTAAPGARA